MKLTDQQRAERKALAEKVAAFNSGTLAQDLAKDYLALLADLEEAEAAAVSPYMDGYESAKEEYRPQIISLEAELAATRQQLAEAQARWIAKPPGLIEGVTKAILFEDSGSTEDWEDNLNLGEAAFKAISDCTEISALQSAIEQAVAPWRSALAAMCEEFRGHDLPYGSMAYKQANDLLYGRVDAGLPAKEKSNG